MAEPNTKKKYIINEDTSIENTDKEIIYQKIFNWLEIKKAKIVSQTPPTAIKAKHGSLLLATDPMVNASKTFVFTLTQEDKNVILSTIVDGPTLPATREETKRLWETLIDELYDDIGVKRKPDRYRQPPPPIAYEKYRKINLRMNGFLLLFFAFMGMFGIISFLRGSVESGFIEFGGGLYFCALMIDSVLISLRKKPLTRPLFYAILLLSSLFFTVGILMVFT